MNVRFASSNGPRVRTMLLVAVLVFSGLAAATPRGTGRAAAQEAPQPVAPAQARFAGRVAFIPQALHPTRQTPNATSWIRTSVTRINPGAYFSLTVYAKNTSKVSEPFVNVFVSWNTALATFESSHTTSGDFVATQSNGLRVQFDRPLAPGQQRYATIVLRGRSGVSNTDLQFSGTYSAAANRAGNVNKITVRIGSTTPTPPPNPGVRFACEFGRGGQGPLGQNPGAGNNPFGTTYTFGAFRRANGGCGFTFSPGARVSYWVAQPTGPSVPVGVYGRADIYGEVELRYNTSGLARVCPVNLCAFAMNAASDTSYVLVAPFNLTRPARSLEVPASVAAEPDVETAQTDDDPEGNPGALGGLTGVVRSAGGTPLAGVQVAVIDPATDELVESTFSQADGSYIIPAGIPSGTYSVLFSASLGTEPANAAFADELVSVTVAEPEIATLDAALDAGGTISGRVTADGSGAGLGEVLVLIYDATLTNVVSASVTDETGAYTSDALPSGNYVVQFDPSSAADDDVTGYTGEYNTNQPLETAAPTPVTLAAPAPLSGVDGALGRCATCGQIAGRVTARDGGAPLPDVSVIVRNAADGSQVAVETTDADGSYDAVLPSGNYTVEFFTDLSPNETTQAYADSYYGAPTPIAVTAPAIVGGINGVLSRGGQLAGTVTGRDTDQPLEEVFVVISNSAGELVSTAFTDVDGRYVTAALPNGNYTLSYQTAASVSELTRAYKPGSRTATISAPGVKDNTNIELTR